MIWGEPGMGKSNLAYELISNLKNQADQRFQFIVGQSDEILRQPFNPFRYWLRRAFQVSDAQGESRNKRNFNHKIDELIAATASQPLADELDRTRSFLGALLDLYWADSLYEQVDAKGRYENTTLALIALLEAECSRQPVLFLLEDAHWLDEDTYAFLPRLLHALNNPERSLPFALLITARTGNFGAPGGRFGSAGSFSWPYQPCRARRPGECAIGRAPSGGFTGRIGRARRRESLLL